MPIEDKHDIQSAYRDTNLAGGYIPERFGRPMGSVQHERQVAWVREALRANGCRRVLELAPGPARLTAHVQGNFDGVAMDYSPEMLSLARKRLGETSMAGRWRLVRGDAFVLPFPDGALDAVYTFRFVRHFREDKRRALVSEIRRVLRPGGVYLSDFEHAPPAREKGNESGGRDRTPAGWIYDALLTPEEIAAEMESLGFATAEIRPNIRHPRLQGQFDRKPGWGFGGLRRCIVRCLERIPGKEPLEWLVLGRKR